jgi:hypothetical protein
MAYLVRHERARKWVGLALVGAGTLVLAACSSSAPQQGQFQRVDRGERQDLMVMLGMRAPPKPNIEYRPRSPLVLPGSTAGLQAPEEGDAAATADFPVDPEIQRAAEHAERDQALVDSQQDVVQRGGIMTPDEVDDWEGRVGRTGRRQPTIIERVMTPRELRDRRLAELPVDSEPPRQVLSQPPEGYRRIQPDANGNIIPPGSEEEEQPRRRWWPF